jgi:hypothetical protein
MEITGTEMGSIASIAKSRTTLKKNAGRELKTVQRQTRTKVYVTNENQDRDQQGQQPVFH